MAGAYPSLYGIKPEQEQAFTEDWLNPRMTARAVARKYGVSTNTACTTAITRLKLPRKRKGRQVAIAGTWHRPACFVCGGATGGRCGCLGQGVA